MSDGEGEGCAEMPRAQTALALRKYEDPEKRL
jgi:hypothetical protein